MTQDGDEVHWLDQRDRIVCTGHTPTPGVAWTRRPEHGFPAERVRQPSPGAQDFIDALLRASRGG